MVCGDGEKVHSINSIQYGPQPGKRGCDHLNRLEIAVMQVRAELLNSNWLDIATMQV